MKRLALVALMSLSACTGVDTVGHPDAKYVTVEGWRVVVSPVDGKPGYFWARDPSDEWLSDRTPVHIRLSAIEALTGCPVDPLSVEHLNGMVSRARAVC